MGWKRHAGALPFLLITSSLAAQPAIQWQQCLGGTAEEFGRTTQQTIDGGYIMAGETWSNNGDVSGNHGLYDAWVVKLDGSGNMQWQRCLGGTGDDRAYSIQQTVDEGYIMAGYTWSNDGDVSGNHGDFDAWVVKLDGAGNIQWQKCMGGTGWDGATSVQQTMDGGYIMGGSSYSNDGDVSGNQGETDAWVVKLDGSGNIQWQLPLGGPGKDAVTDIQQTNDGGYAMTALSRSTNGDVSGNNGGQDAWLVKLDGSGNLQWQKCLGGSDTDAIDAFQQTTDGGFIAAGWTASNDGDVSGNHGFRDAWVIKLDGTGTMQWQKCLGGTDWDRAASIQQTTDGGYIMAGFSFSTNGDVSGNNGLADAWMVKLDGSGDPQWQQCLGGTGHDHSNSIHQTTDGGYIVAGDALSNDGDVPLGHGSGDAWVIKLAPDGTTTISELPEPGLTLYPTLTNGLVYLTTERAQGVSTISLLNPPGRVLEVVRASGTRFVLDLRRYRSGIYLVKVLFADGTQETKRVVKE